MNAFRKNFTKQFLILFAISILASELALSSIVQSVQVVRNPFLSNNDFTVEIYKSKDAKCTAIKSINFDKGSQITVDQEIRIFLEIEQHEECKEIAKNPLERIFIGYIPNGEHVLRIYENSQLAFSKKFYFSENQSTFSSVDFQKVKNFIENNKIEKITIKNGS